MAGSSKAPNQEEVAAKVSEENSPNDGAASVAWMKAMEVAVPTAGDALTDEDVAAIVNLIEEDAAMLAMERADVIKPKPLVSTRTIHSETHETIEFFLPLDASVPRAAIMEPDDAETMAANRFTAQMYENFVCLQRKKCPEDEEVGFVIEPLEKKAPSECVPVIINGIGTLEKVCLNDQVYFVIAVKFAPVKVLVRETSFYVDGLLSKTGLESYIGKEVRFVASSPANCTHTSGASYGAHFCWLGEKPPTSVFLEPFKGPELSVVALGSPHPGIIYIGVVRSNPQPDHCIVSFRLGLVYVSDKSLLVDPWTKDTCPVAVSDYLKRGEVVAFTLKSEDYMEANLCGTLPDISRRSIQETILFDKTGQSEKTKQIGGLESSLTDMLLCEREYLNENFWYRGVVVYIFSQQDAIALVGVIRVLINIGEVVKDQSKGDVPDIIGEHLEIGTPVLLRVQPQNSLDSVYYCATKARIISDSVEATVLRNQRGTIAHVSDGGKQCSVTWSCGVETRHVRSAFHLLRSEAALADYARTNSKISCRTLKEEIARDAPVTVTEFVSYDGLVPDGAWFIR